MKDFLKQQIGPERNRLKQTSLVREYLQARVLESLQDNGAFLNWAFLGGTALRFLYRIPRYSEDMDFSLANPNEDCEFDRMLNGIKRTFENEGYSLTFKRGHEKAVMSAFLGFPGLLFEMGVSPHASEVLAIKLEIDINPPAGAVTETTICRRFVTVNVNHYDRASLLAGKLHAILSRRYTKGRDLYDLVWSLADQSWPAPNFRLLNAALAQTGWNGPELGTGNWRKVLGTRMSELQWDKVADDLAPFIERPEDLKLVTRENCEKMLQRERA